MEKTKKKPPLQERSKQTVQAILEASARILGKDGLAALNTNRISEVAGVSVGSVYQFFRNKDSILEELLTRVLDQNVDELLRILETENSRETGLRSFVEKVVGGIFSNFEKRGFVMNALLENAPQLIGLKRIQKVDERIIPKVMEKMQSHGVKIRPKDAETAIFVVMQAVRGVTSMAYARKMSEAERARIKRELVDLCVRYLDVE